MSTNPQPPPYPFPPVYSRSDNELGKLWHEQSKLLWGRIQTAYLIEAGTLAGFYVLARDGHGGWAIGMLVLSIILHLALFAVIWRDVQHLDQLGELESLPVKRIDPWLGVITGRRLAKAVPIILIAANVVLVISMLRFGVDNWIAK